MRDVGKEMRGLASRWTASRSGRISIVYTALVQAPSGSIQASGEPACPATGHAQNDGLFESQVAPQILDGPLAKAVGAYSPHFYPQPGRRSTIELASPASALGRNTTKGRVELPWLAVIQVLSRPATSGGATNGGGCRFSRPRDSCNAMAKKRQPTQYGAR